MSEVENKVPKDAFDREIRLGDICAYPVRRRSSMWLNKMTVQKITYDVAGNPKIHGQKQDGYKVRVASLDRVVIIGRNNVIPFLE
jgi:hypothetical protein